MCNPRLEIRQDYFERFLKHIFAVTLTLSEDQKAKGLAQKPEHLGGAKAYLSLSLISEQELVHWYQKNEKNSLVNSNYMQLLPGWTTETARADPMTCAPKWRMQMMARQLEKGFTTNTGPIAPTASDPAQPPVPAPAPATEPVKEETKPDTETETDAAQIEETAPTRATDPAPLPAPVLVSAPPGRADNVLQVLKQLRYPEEWCADEGTAREINSAYISYMQTLEGVFVRVGAHLPSLVTMDKKENLYIRSQQAPSPGPWDKKSLSKTWIYVTEGELGSFQDMRIDATDLAKFQADG
ncbi:hypothetical protein NM208_g11927 [Fusarium decemcellulare]|uniref:Uncharacterized protein n=1 Tax=Fusarium decemcellulare TaxID=57161 RepID=A0ACC1RUD8_9HYPO|nr:hypothetical protein NM208_g11927 [Fusarium decemcellulare]